MFVGDLCVALHKDLPAVLAMSAAEFAFWKAYWLKRGWPADRIEGATAVSGAAQIRSWGGKVEPKDLLPKFGPAQVNPKVLAARLSALPGAKVRRIPRPDRKRSAAPRQEEPPPPRRLLNPR